MIFRVGVERRRILKLCLHRHRFATFFVSEYVRVYFDKQTKSAGDLRQG